MVDANSIKTTVTGIIEDLGSDVIINRDSGKTFDKWGDPTPGSITTESIKAVPISYFKELRVQQLAGIHNSSNFILIIKGDETLLFSDDDYVTYGGVDYSVDSVEPIPLQNVVLAQSLLLSKK